MDAMRHIGNPSSVHAEGRAERGVVETARRSIADLAGCPPGAVVFTSGATEANAWVLRARRGMVFASEIEHPSVLENAGNFHTIPVDPNGVVDLGYLAHALERARTTGSDGTADQPLTVTLMAANNETGVMQPVQAAADLCQKHGAWLHVDGVQAAGKYPLEDICASADSLALSGHKIGGPTGVGALILREGRSLTPLIAGGGQEQRRRAGTENVPGIAGFGAAARAAKDEIPLWSGIRDRRDHLEAEMSRLIPDVKIFGVDVDRLPNTTCAAVAGISAELLLMRLDLAGIAISAGSACSSGKVTISPVLNAMGVESALAQGAIRISQGLYTTNAELERFLISWEATVKRKSVSS